MPEFNEGDKVRILESCGGRIYGSDELGEVAKPFHNLREGHEYVVTLERGDWIPWHLLELIESAEAPDAINPTHYQFPNGVQVIDVTENLPFLEGNVIKYVARHREKNGLEDLRKAKWYLDRLIEKETP